MDRMATARLRLHLRLRPLLMDLMATVHLHHPDLRLVDRTDTVRRRRRLLLSAARMTIDRRPIIMVMGLVLSMRFS